jgi:hypothetical protein
LRQSRIRRRADVCIFKPGDPIVNVSVPLAGIPHLGGVALFSTITTAARGIVCMDAETVETGALDAGVAMPAAAELRQLFGQR